MKNQVFLSKQCIINCLKTIYGVNTSVLISLSGGADLGSETYKTETRDQTSYFVKVKEGTDHATGILLQQLLHNTGIQQIIAPTKTIDGKLFHTMNDFTLIVYPFMNGYDGFHHHLNKNQWITLGKALKRTHTFDVPSSIRDKIKHEDYSPKWRNAVRSIYERIETIKSDDPITLTLKQFMKVHKKRILQLVNIADTLAKEIQKKNQPFVLCHADIHAGNVLAQDDSNICIIDWDVPIMAPKERDLMFIGGGVGNVWNNPHEIQFFYAGYGATKVDLHILTYYRCERIIEDIAIYCQDILSSNNTNKAESYKFLTDIFEPNGVVDIALKTATLL